MTDVLWAITRMADAGWPGWIMLAVLALIVLLVLCFICWFVYDTIDCKTAFYRRHRDIVKDRHYNGARTATGVGPAIGSTGGVAVTVSYTPAEYWLEFKTLGLRQVARGSFDSVSVGDRVWVGERVGGLSNSVLQTWVEDEG